ncbi:hypothetical protein FVE85_4935 [Porphyridium purpureum]|uniref:Uncharacterized protein n=1 Tax=Porphyridium purpureum TaxID=35688 RepID=A0A5J4YR94_PORPP|nr:hypothetical protein FVE85_4935 [Porphyridium purpureum]|eukprot:POR8216..scf236_6
MGKMGIYGFVLPCPLGGGSPLLRTASLRYGQRVAVRPGRVRGVCVAVGINLTDGAQQRTDDETDDEQDDEPSLDDLDAQSRAQIRDSVKRLFGDNENDEDEGDSSETETPGFLEYDEEWDDETPVEDGYVRVKEDEDSYTIRGKDLERLLLELDAGEDFVERAYSKSTETSSSDAEKDEAQPANGDTSEYYEGIASALKDGTREKKGVMNYFDEKNKEFMPSWLREAYERGDEELFTGTEAVQFDADDVRQQAPNRRREKIEDSEKMAVMEAATIGETASDFRVPVEFILDEVAALGARKPILPTDILEDRLLEDEIAKLTEVLTSFDCADLCDRYSDRTIREIAAYYELDVEDVEDICGAEGIELCLGADTHILKIREEQLLFALEPLLSRQK